MQGHKSSLTTLPENLSFDHGSASSESDIDSQMSWNNLQASTHNRLPDYRIPVGHEGLNSEWSLGESSSHIQGDNNESKREHTWSIRSRPSLTLDGPQYQPPDILSSDNNIDINANISQTANTYMSIGSSNEQMPSSIGSSFGLPSEYVTDENEAGPHARTGHSIDGRRISCKRKSLEVHVGQSSHAERSNICSMSMLSETRPVAISGTGPANPRLRLGVGGPPLTTNPSCPAAESPRRNFRLRINGSRQQDHHITSYPILPVPEPVNADNPYSQNSPGLLLRNQLFDLNPPPSVENGSSIHGQSGLLHVPSVRRNTHSTWGGSISSRMSNSALSGERDPMLHEESMPRNIPRSISEHPMFVPASEIGILSQQPMNWNLTGNSSNNNSNIAGNVESTSRLGPTSGMNSSGPSWANRSRPQYSRRLSEIVRRSLSSATGIESSGSQSSSQALRPGLSQGMVISSGSGNHGPHLLNSRSALSERQHVDGGLGLPYSLRSLAGVGEGRTSLMSEQIRHVLDLMRRGEGLRLEDVMILDNSVLFGMADMHDRHRDMRLDVDNMSYEELLALEERIGSVCTGLNEETIMSRLKQQKYIIGGTQNQAEMEPCSICREEYNDGEDLATLECRHDFHRDCIKQWLMHKNLCPICKTTGLTT